MLKTVLKFFNGVKGWFAYVHVRVGKIFLFNRTYNTELYIVTDSIEKVYLSKKNPAELRHVKDMIKNRMREANLSKGFNSYLKIHGIMRSDQVE